MVKAKKTGYNKIVGSISANPQAVARKPWQGQICNETYLIISSLFCILLFIFHGCYFGALMLPFVWLFAGFMVVLLFFIGVNYSLKNWSSLHTRTFLTKVFLYSLIIRIIATVFLYFVFLKVNGTPFSIEQADEYNYHNFAIDIASAWQDGDFEVIRWFPWGFSYIGYPVFCGSLYFLFGSSTIVARIANCVINSFSVLLIYKISKLLWDEHISRAASIIAMLFPWMIFYSAVQLKDVVLTFIVLFALYEVISLYQNKKASFLKILFAVISVTLIFTFRTVVGAIAIISIFAYFVLQLYKPMRFNLLRFFLGIGIVLGSFLFLMIIGGKEASYNRLTSGYQLSDVRPTKWVTYGSNLSNYASIGLFSILAFPAPFPTVVDVPNDSSTRSVRPEYYHIGTTLTWNILSFFALIGMYITIKSNFRKSSPLWIFSLLYLFTLAQSTFIMDERFKLVITPFLIMFTVVGMQYKWRNKNKLWILYLLILGVFIFGWNYFRLSGRGIL